MTSGRTGEASGQEVVFLLATAKGNLIYRKIILIQEGYQRRQDVSPMFPLQGDDLFLTAKTESLDETA